MTDEPVTQRNLASTLLVDERATTPEAVISFEQAVKDYGPKEIGPVTFSVGRGEIVGFLGPNGSGKSTTIRMLLGLIKPTSGKVRLMQRDPLRDHVRALEQAGYSPELPNLQSFLTPKELLRLTAKELGLTPQGDGRPAPRPARGRRPYPVSGLQDRQAQQGDGPEAERRAGHDGVPRRSSSSTSP